MSNDVSTLTPVLLRTLDHAYYAQALRPDEVDSDAEAAGGSDDDIAMPEGPPPGPALAENEELVDSDEDIPMPDGPPPPSDGVTQPQRAYLHRSALAATKLIL